MISATTRTPLETNQKYQLGEGERPKSSAKASKYLDRSWVDPVNQSRDRGFSGSSNSRSSISAGERTPKNLVNYVVNSRDITRPVNLFNSRRKVGDSQRGVLPDSAAKGAQGVHVEEKTQVKGKQVEEQQIKNDDNYNVTKQTEMRKFSRGTKKFQLNVHDREEVEFMKTKHKDELELVDEVKNEIDGEQDSEGMMTTKKSQFVNKYNIDYDNSLEDEYEIIQTIE